MVMQLRFVTCYRHNNLATMLAKNGSCDKLMNYFLLF